MGVRFEAAGNDVLETIASVVSKYHTPLRDAGVTIEAVLAFAEVDEDSSMAVAPAVTAGGYPCAVKIKVMGLADRTLDSADARITIDGDNWEILSDKQQAALIDHAVSHLELVTKIKNEQEVVQRDDLDRPKMKLRKHDHQYGWFDEIVRRHGKASPEWSQCETFLEKREQLWLTYIAVDEEVG